jgi:hypothetical protein
MRCEVTRLPRSKKGAQMKRNVRRVFAVTPLVLAAAFLLGSSRPAHAGCFIDLADCYGRAAQETSYWRSVLASADCELAFVTCARIAVIGR